MMIQLWGTCKRRKDSIYIKKQRQRWVVHKGASLIQAGRCLLRENKLYSPVERLFTLLIHLLAGINEEREVDILKGMNLRYYTSLPEIKLKCAAALFLYILCNG